MTPPALSWIAAPRADRGIDFGAAGYWGYDRLAASAVSLAAGLARLGISAGDVVAVIAVTGPDFVIGALGAMLAGAAVSPIPPPLVLEDRSGYAGHVAGLLAAADPAAVLIPEAVADRAGLWRHGRIRVHTVGEVTGAGRAGWRPPTGAGPLALVQLTSGSQGPPRAVRIGWPAVTANVTAITEWLRIGPEDAVASWLPLYHDMGLVGILLTTLASQANLRLMAPDEFLRQPLEFLRQFGAGGATLTAMPTFGLGHVLRRVRSAALDGLDFGRWRGLIIGAEPVDAALLDRFSGLLEPHGFVRRSLLPAYGLAEATVAVTGCSLDEEPTVVHASPAVAIGQPVRLHSMAGADTIALVGCGPPLRGVRVSIVDEHGAAVPDGHSGEIVVSGPSVADSVADQATGSHTRIAAGRVWTGDVGVLVGGQLFVLGRIGDCVKVRGQTLFAEALEARAARAGADPGRTAILLGMERGEPTAVLLIERSDPQTRRAVSAALRRSLDGVPLIVVDAPTRTIMRTSSGKPRRRQMWQRYAAGLLGPGQGERPS